MRGRHRPTEWMDGQDSLAKPNRRQPPALFPLRKLFWIANRSFFVPIWAGTPDKEWLLSGIDLIIWDGGVQMT
jgi:hypothetical protein